MREDKNTKLSDLNINRLTLFFNDRQIEEQFRQEYFDKSIGSFRLSFIIVTLLYALFGILDVYTSKEFVNEFYLIRYAIVVPVLFFVLVLSFLSRFRNYWQLLIGACYVIAGVGITYMLLKNPENIFYYGGLFLIFIAGYFFIHLHFLWAVIPGILILLAFNIGASINSFSEYLNTAQLLTSNAFFLSANVIALAALYKSKLMERKEFHQRLLLSTKQNEIQQINENLESIVTERTQLLEKRNEILNTEIDSRKTAEEQLLEAIHKAEESDRLKTAFLANMSHEIRTPMNGIIGFLDIIASPDLTDEEQQQYLEIIKQSGNRLLQTINDIVELSKIEAGEQTVHPSEINLDKIFKYITEFFSIDIADKKLKFLVTNQIENHKIESDSNKLESILINLINNAIKFTDEGYIEVLLSEDNGKLKFCVKDTGKGIPQDRKDAIFDRFVQADLSLNRGHEGSGLGLSICKAYVEMLGGEIWLKSEPEKGTKFFFTIEHIPVINTPENTEEHKPKIISSSNKITALVVEDDDISFNLISVILRNEDIDIIWAQNGIEAIEKYKAHSNIISIIVMDIKMPIMDGGEATRRIRLMNKHIPIIAQTAFAMSGDREEAINAGCNEYLSKPLKANELIAAINKFVTATHN